jgi:hypothetical protein
MILALLGYLFHAGTLLKRGEEREALERVSAELRRLDRPP